MATGEGLTEAGIIIGGRAPPPSAWRHPVETPAIEFSWHHTIPLENLTKMWNGLVKGSHWEAIDQYLQLIGMPMPAVVIKQIKAGRVQARDDLWQRIQWPSWNIVEGPGGKNRPKSDDPGSSFEKWYSGSLSSNQRQVIYAVTSIYAAIRKIPMDAGSKADPTISARLAKDLANAFKHNKSALRGKGPIKWTSEMWTVDVAGRAHPRRNEWLRNPKWVRR